MQVDSLHKAFDELQKMHGHESLQAIYGAECIEKPKVMMIFMNPTSKNVSAHKNWKGSRASWLGTKSIWSLLHEVDLLSDSQYAFTQSLKPQEWSQEHCNEIYTALRDQGVYITNLAKCTQLDARPLKDEVFRQYLDVMKQEISQIRPQRIVTFGNQVSSIVLSKLVSVSKYEGTDKEELSIEGVVYSIYPTYYPVGHGRMHQPKTVKRLIEVLK